MHQRLPKVVNTVRLSRSSQINFKCILCAFACESHILIWSLYSRCMMQQTYKDFIFNSESWCLEAILFLVSCTERGNLVFVAVSTLHLVGIWYRMMSWNWIWSDVRNFWLETKLMHDATELNGFYARVVFFALHVISHYDNIIMS